MQGCISLISFHSLEKNVFILLLYTESKMAKILLKLLFSRIPWKFLPFSGQILHHQRKIILLLIYSHRKFYDPGKTYDAWVMLHDCWWPGHYALKIFRGLKNIFDGFKDKNYWVHDHLILSIIQKSAYRLYGIAFIVNFSQSTFFITGWMITVLWTFQDSWKYLEGLVKFG